MVRRSFRVGLRLGLLIGIGFALFKTFQSRRPSGGLAASGGGDWEPLRSEAAAPAEPATVVRGATPPRPAAEPVPDSLRMPDVPDPLVPPSAASEGRAATSTPPLPPTDLPVDEVGEPIELPAAPPEDARSTRRRRAADPTTVATGDVTEPTGPASPPAAGRTEPAARTEPAGAARAEPAAAVRTEPAATPRTEPAATPRTEPAAAPRTEPAATPRPEPAAAPRTEPSADPSARTTPLPPEPEAPADPRDVVAEPAPVESPHRSEAAAPAEAPTKKTAARKKAAAPKKKEAAEAPSDDIVPATQSAKKAAKKATKKAEKASKKATKKGAVPETPAPPAWVAASDGTCPPTHPVKAKLASKLFHLPGMFAYDRTRPDRCYLDADAATSEGFTQAKR